MLLLLKVNLNKDLALKFKTKIIFFKKVKRECTQLSNS